MRARNHARSRRGLTLLEVLVAIAILGMSAAALAGLMSQGMHSVRAAGAGEADVQAAAQALSRVSLWTAQDFASHSGRNAYRGLILVVGQRTPSLYDVTLADTVRGSILLHTSFYRRDPSAAAQR